MDPASQRTPNRTDAVRSGGYSQTMAIELSRRSRPSGLTELTLRVRREVNPEFGVWDPGRPARHRFRAGASFGAASSDSFGGRGPGLGVLPSEHSGWTASVSPRDESTESPWSAHKACDVVSCSTWNMLQAVRLAFAAWICRVLGNQDAGASRTQCAVDHTRLVKHRTGTPVAAMDHPFVTARSGTSDCRPNDPARVGLRSTSASCMAHVARDVVTRITYVL